MKSPKYGPKLKLYWEFAHIGTSSFLTFYVIMAAVNYWQVVYDSTFSTVACTLANMGEIIGTLLTIKWFGKMPAYKVVIWGIFVSVSLLVILPTFFFLPDAIRPWLTMIPLLACGTACGVLYTVQSGSGARIGQHTAQALALGVGCSAVVIQFLQNGISLCLKLDPKAPDYKYNLLYNVIVFHCLGIACLLSILLTWKRIARIAPDAVGLRSQEEVLVQEVQPSASIEPASTATVPSKTEELLSSDVSVVEKRESEPKEEKQVSKFDVLRIIWPSFACQILTYFITYSLFPALYTAVPCYMTQERINPWFNLIQLSVYFLGDFMGRLSPRFRCFNKFGLKPTLVLALSRLALFVMYPLMAFPRPQFSKGIVPLIHNDYISVPIGALFAYSTGLSSTLLFMRFQDQLPTKAEKQAGAFLLSLAFEIGEFFAGVAGILLAMLIKSIDAKNDSQ